MRKKLNYTVKLSPRAIEVLEAEPNSDEAAEQALRIVFHNKFVTSGDYYEVLTRKSISAYLVTMASFLIFTLVAAFFSGKYLMSAYHNGELSILFVGVALAVGAIGGLFDLYSRLCGLRELNNGELSQLVEAVKGYPTLSYTLINWIEDDEIVLRKRDFYHLIRRARKIKRRTDAKERSEHLKQRDQEAVHDLLGTLKASAEEQAEAKIEEDEQG